MAPRDPSPTDSNLDQMLRRDARLIRPSASPGFADRVKSAIASCPETLPFPRAESPVRWPLYALAAAAILVLSAGLLLLRDRPVPAMPSTQASPVAQVADKPPTKLAAPSLAAIDLNPFSIVPATPLDAELKAIGTDVRNTGAFLMSCLPGYPGSTR